MNRLHAILENYYFPEEKDLILASLMPLGIDKILDSAIKGIEVFNETTLPLKSNQMILGAIFTPTFTSINEIIGKITDKEYKSLIKATILDIVNRLLFRGYTSLLNIVSKNEFFKLIEELCTQYNYNFTDFKEHFKLAETFDILENINGKSISSKQKEVKKGNLNWVANENSKRELIEILTRERWIKNAKSLNKLFKNPTVKLKIICNEKHLDEISLLWYRLNMDGYIKSKYTKGYFKAFNKYCHGLNNQPLRENIFKEKSSKILKNKDKFNTLIERIDGIVINIKERARN